MSKQPQQWFIKVGTEQSGPHTSIELMAFTAQGKVTPDTRVRLTTSDKWLRAKQITGLVFQGDSSQPSAVNSAPTTPDSGQQNALAAHPGKKAEDAQTAPAATGMQGPAPKRTFSIVLLSAEGQSEPCPAILSEWPDRLTFVRAGSDGELSIPRDRVRHRCQFRRRFLAEGWILSMQQKEQQYEFLIDSPEAAQLLTGLLNRELCPLCGGSAATRSHSSLVHERSSNICLQCSHLPCWVDGCNERATLSLPHEFFVTEKGWGRRHKLVYARNDVCLCEKHGEVVRSLRRNKSIANAMVGALVGLGIIAFVFVIAFVASWSDPTSGAKHFLGVGIAGVILLVISASCVFATHRYYSGLVSGEKLTRKPALVKHGTIGERGGSFIRDDGFLKCWEWSDQRRTERAD